MSTATKAIFAIDNMDELHEAQSALNVRFRELQRDKAREFRVGQKVCFRSSYGDIIHGAVSKVNLKTVTVNSGLQRWKVSPSLLKGA